MKIKKTEITYEDLKKIRLKIGMTQEQIAADLGVSARTWRRWESGEYRVPRIVRLALIEIEESRKPART